MERPYTRKLSAAVRCEIQEFYKDISLSIRVLEWGEIVGVMPSTTLATNSSEFTAYEATRLMAGLLGSELRYSICKCRKPEGRTKECGIYFVRSRREECLRRGSYCAEHTKGAGTAIKREQEQRERLELALNFAPQWYPERDKLPPFALWLKDKINEARGTGKELVKRNWVTTHFDVNTGEQKRQVREFEKRSVTHEHL
jgi:hypothetical protein